jgi:hypothetical protein
MYCYILFDNFTKSLIAVYDDEKKINEDLNKLVLKDMDAEILLLHHKILDEVNHDKRQLLMMTLDNIEVQKALDKGKKTMYYKNGDVIQRYLKYSKEMNKISSNIFFHFDAKVGI